MISAILLAAGESRRMGEFKQLLHFGSKTFVEQCVDILTETKVGEIIVVTGHRDADLRRVVGDCHVKYAYNPDYSLGMATSIKCGVQAVNVGSQAFLIALVDQPQITAEVIGRIIQEYERMPPKIVVPTNDGTKGHPILLDASLKDEILRLDPEEGLRQLVHRHSDSITKVDVSSRTVLEDCDFPEDYRRLIRDLEGSD